MRAELVHAREVSAGGVVADLAGYRHLGQFIVGETFHRAIEDNQTPIVRDPR
ncbi:MAG TPA: hypothetical protein VFT80_02030 [Actinomycetota bacterium]|nr:hypothetical protein [Actinomycetota bacterium]